MFTCGFLDAWFLPDCCTFQSFCMQSIKAQAMQRLQSISPSYQLNVTCHNKPSDIEADQPELLWRSWHDISGWTWAVTLQDIYIISYKRWCFDFFLSFFQLFSLSMMNIAVFPSPSLFNSSSLWSSALLFVSVTSLKENHLSSPCASRRVRDQAKCQCSGFFSFLFPPHAMPVIPCYELYIQTKMYGRLIHFHCKC